MKDPVNIYNSMKCSSRSPNDPKKAKAALEAIKKVINSDIIYRALAKEEENG